MNPESEGKNSKAASKISLGDVRDILIIAGIFLFFTGWVYVYYFYNYFGLSISLVSISYADYLVYSYNVFTSYYLMPLLALVILVLVYRKWFVKYVSLTIFLAVVLFPVLYFLAKKTADKDALEMRSFRKSMRHISFVFKEDADLLAYKFDNDSIHHSSHIVKGDLDILKDTSLPSHLYLLGQNQEYFFVLHQEQGLPEIKSLPFGNVYFINKSYVLYSKVTLTSN
jgi:hypothetical protein